jgi:predicted dehydrogenase
MISRPTRRTVLKGMAAGTAGLALANPILRAQSPTTKLSVAGIGVGGMMGMGTLGPVGQHKQVHVAALCDVDANHLARAAKRFPDARTYADWRELLAKEGDKIDAVTVAVPDHMHAAISVSAMRAGKHIYCQKPLAHDVFEVRQMELAARKAGVVTQLGTQHASGIGDRMGVQMVRDGVIGKIKEVYLWSNRPGHEGYRRKDPRPAKSDPVPKHVQWDLWLGTAPQRPFVNGIYHPVRWRTWIDFGTGWGGDIGCHIGSAVFHALGLTRPTKVTAQVEPAWISDPARRRDVWPKWQVIEFEYPGTDMTAGKTIKATWLDGYKWPSKEVHKLFENCKWPGEAAIFIGTQGGMLLPHGGGPQFFPKAKFSKINRPKLPGMNHYQHWVDACIAGKRTMPLSNFDFAGKLGEAIILGTVAARCPGTALRWDSAKLKFANSDEANKLIRRTYRKGWEVAGL